MIVENWDFIMLFEAFWADCEKYQWNDYVSPYKVTEWIREWGFFSVKRILAKQCEYQKNSLLKISTYEAQKNERA